MHSRVLGFVLLRRMRCVIIFDNKGWLRPSSFLQIEQTYVHLEDISESNPFVPHCLAAQYSVALSFCNKHFLGFIYFFWDAVNTARDQRRSISFCKLACRRDLVTIEIIGYSEWLSNEYFR